MVAVSLVNQSVYNYLLFVLIKFSNYRNLPNLPYMELVPISFLCLLPLIYR